MTIQEHANKRIRDNNKKLGAITYLVNNSVYSNEWTGAGMYEAIEKIVKAPQKTRFTKEYLKSLLKKAENF